MFCRITLRKSARSGALPQGLNTTLSSRSSPRSVTDRASGSPSQIMIFAGWSTRIAFSSDTFPNKWWIKHTKNSDLAVHECFAPPSVLIDKQKWPPSDALNVGTQVHTSPAQFGKVMSDIRPRLAVGYHFFNDFDTLPAVNDMVRKTYDGPLALAMDYMVFNVTKDDIRVRMAVIDEDIWPQPSVTEKLPADPSQKIGFSDFITNGRVPYSDVVEKVYADINKRYGSNVKPPK